MTTQNEMQHQIGGGAATAEMSPSLDEGTAAAVHDGELKILAFCCTWCSYQAADLAGTSRTKYASNVRLVRVPCSGRVDPWFVLKAFEEGADGVLVTGCHPGDCHYVKGNLFAESRFGRLTRLVDMLGIGAGRIRLEWVSAAEGDKFARTANEFTDAVKALGPMP